ncbi:hypothetical protein [Jeotgalibacillus proteolyticus]|nr:hypothetical protein [Jeotgalibacillus proteolyticus]
MFDGVMMLTNGKLNKRISNTDIRIEFSADLAGHLNQSYHSLNGSYFN